MSLNLSTSSKDMSGSWENLSQSLSDSLIAFGGGGTACVKWALSWTAANDGLNQFRDRQMLRRELRTRGDCNRIFVCSRVSQTRQPEENIQDQYSTDHRADSDLPRESSKGERKQG